MATYYASEIGDGAHNGTTPGDAWNISEISWPLSAGDILYLLDTITSTISPPSGAGGAGNPITFRGDYAGRPCFMDSQGVTNDIIQFNIKFFYELRNITFINPSPVLNEEQVLINQSSGCGVYDCNFISSGKVGRGIKLNAQGTSNGLNRITIQGNTFDGLYNGVVFNNFATGPTSVPNRITFKGNTFESCYETIKHLMDRVTWTQVLGGFKPYGIDIDGNIINNCTWALIQVVWTDGFGVVNGYESYVRNNIITNSGDVTVAQVNCIQMENAHGGYVEYNVVDGVIKTPEDGDGHCFIFDYDVDANDPQYYSTGIIVRYNVFKNATSTNQTQNCSGIRAYRGVDNICYCNYIEACQTGIGNSGQFSTGNVYYSNTCNDIIQNGFQADQSSAACTLSNNIFSMRSGNKAGLANDLTAVDPVESYSVIAGATTNTVAPDVTSINIADAKLDANGVPTSGSPCIGFGVAWFDTLEPRPLSLSGEPWPDIELDAGSTETLFNPNHPKNL